MTRVSHPRLTRAPGEPPAANAHWLIGAGGMRLFASAQFPEAEPPVGAIYVVVGPEIGSAELYPKFIAAARGAGFVVAVVHPRGAGYSDGVRGDIDDYALFVADLAQGVEWVRQCVPARTPLFLLGHSAGAALALELAARSTHPAGLILVNPAYRLRYGPGMGPSWADYVAYGWNFVFRRSALTVDMNRSPADISDLADRGEAEAMQRDPFVVRYFSLRYLLAQRRVMNRCAVNARATDAPVLLIQGARDALVDPAGNDEILAAARSTDKTKLIAADAAHGSTAVETMVDRILAWLCQHTSPTVPVSPSR